MHRHEAEHPTDVSMSAPAHTTHVQHPGGHPGADAQPYPAGEAYVGGQPYGGLPPYLEAPPESRAYRFLVALWTKPAWLAPLAVLGCIGAAFSYVMANDPTDAQRDPLGPCAFKTLTGLDCPGCGGTRMVWYLLHGNVGEAARHHLVALIALPVVLYAYVVWGARRIFNLTLPTRRIVPAVWGGYLAVWLAFSVLRNLPWAPFDYLYV